MPRRINDFPFSPARCPFFYGWCILVAGTLGIIVSSPGQTIGVSAFTEPLLESLSISRSALSMAYAVGTAVSGMLLTLAGRLYDRIGARISGTIAVVGLGITLLGLSYIAVLIDGVVGLRILAAYRVPIAVCIIASGFLLLRFFGQGLLTITSRNMVMEWFVHRRGLANGLMGVCIGLAFSSSPPVFHRMIQLYTWQGTWRLTGLVTVLGFGALTLLFFRDSPESCGLLPDNGRKPDQSDPPHQPRIDSTLHQAIRSYDFWVFSAALAMPALYGTAFAFHVESLLGQAGLSASQAYAVFFPAAIISVFIGLLVGWLSDHFRLKVFLLLMLSGMLLSMSGVCINRGTYTVALIVIGNGISNGMFGMLLGVNCVRYFGRRHLGEISGLQMSCNVLASAIGPWFFALSASRFSSYQPAILFCMAVTVVLLLAGMRVERSV